MENPVPTPEQPLLQAPSGIPKRPTRPYKIILMVVAVLSLALNTLTIGFGMRNGFEETDTGIKPTTVGTVLLVITNAVFVFFTLKISFCLMSSTFPTWPELKELREAIRYMLATSMLGLALWSCSIDLLKDRGFINREAAPLGDYKTIDKPADAPISETDLEFTIQEGSSHSIVESIENFLAKEASRNDSDTLAYSTTTDKNRKDTTQGSDSLSYVTSPRYSTAINNNESFPSNRHANKSKRESGNLKEEESTMNVPVVTLFLCSFSFVMPVAVTLLAIFFEIETHNYLTRMGNREINSSFQPARRTTYNFPSRDGEDTVCQSRETYVTNVNGEDEGDGSDSSLLPQYRENGSTQNSHSSDQTLDSRSAIPPRPVNGHPLGLYPFPPNQVFCYPMPCHPQYNWHMVRRQTGAIPKKINKYQDQKKSSSSKSPSSDVLYHDELVATGGSSPQNGQDYGAQNKSSVPTEIPVVDAANADQLLEGASRNLATAELHSVNKETEDIEMTLK